MMKKTYIQPETTVMAVETSQMLAESTFDATQETQSVTLTNGEYNGAFAAKSHHNYVNWDEE